MGGGLGAYSEREALPNGGKRRRWAPRIDDALSLAASPGIACVDVAFGHPGATC